MSQDLVDELNKKCKGEKNWTLENLREGKNWCYQGPPPLDPQVPYIVNLICSRCNSILNGEVIRKLKEQYFCQECIKYYMLGNIDDSEQRFYQGDKYFIEKNRYRTEEELADRILEKMFELDICKDCRDATFRWKLMLLS